MTIDVTKPNIAHNWIDSQSLIDFIAVSESTPGPFAVNIATYVGAEVGGIFGSFCATLGVILPSLYDYTFLKLNKTFCNNKNDNKGWEYHSECWFDWFCCNFDEFNRFHTRWV